LPNKGDNEVGSPNYSREGVSGAPNKERRERSREVTGELGHNLVGYVPPDFHKYAEHPSACDGWRAVAEAYGEDRLEIHVHFRLMETGRPRVSPYYCAIFERAPAPFHGVGRHHELGGIRMNGTPNQEESQVEQPMLVEIRKPVEHPEGVRFEVIPSFVRLQALDNCLRSWGDAPDSLLARASTHGFGAKDGEFGVLDEFGGGRVSMPSDNEFVNEVVESGAEVMQDLSNDETKQRGWVVEDFEPNLILANLRLEFVDEFVRVSVEPSVNLGFQALQVMERPT
jgi:hypothetical protein